MTDPVSAVENIVTAPGKFERFMIISAAVLIVGLGLWCWGDYHGHNVTNAKWQLKYDSALLAAQKDHDAMQAKMEKQAAEYLAHQAAADANYAHQLQEMKDAMRNNPAFSTCHAGPDFVRIYNSVATGTSKSKPDAGAGMPAAGGAAK